MTDREQLAAYCADPAGFMDSIRARKLDDVAAPAAKRSFETTIAIAADVQAEPEEETNVIAVDFAAAAAERDQAEAEAAEAFEPYQASDDLAARVAQLERIVASLTGAAPTVANCPEIPDGSTVDVQAAEIAQLRAALAESETARAQLQREVATLRAGQDSLAESNASLAADLARARADAAANLDNAQQQAERAVSLSHKLKAAEGELARLSPLASALSAVDVSFPVPPPVPIRPVLVDHRGREIAAAL